MTSDFSDNYFKVTFPPPPLNLWGPYIWGLIDMSASSKWDNRPSVYRHGVHLEVTSRLPWGGGHPFEVTSRSPLVWGKFLESSRSPWGHPALTPRSPRNVTLNESPWWKDHLNNWVTLIKKTTFIVGSPSIRLASPHSQACSRLNPKTIQWVVNV